MLVRRRRSDCRLIISNRRDDEPEAFTEARALLTEAYATSLRGVLPATLGRNAENKPRRYAEAIRLHLEHRLGVTWVLFVPYTWVEASTETVEARRAGLARPADPAGAWIAERWAVRRRNETWARLVDGWSRAISPDSPGTTVHTAPSPPLDGTHLDAVFVIGHVNAFSRRAG